MIRIQVQLTEEQSRRLKTLAAERGVSVAAVVREAVDAQLSGASARVRAVKYLGRFRSGLNDVSENHDRYLAEDFVR